MSTEKVILRMEKICKSFNHVQVLFDVDFSLAEGEIMGLIGENGAGKSTLMKILTGEYQRDSGRIEVFGKEADLSTPRKALELGIAMVYQELNNAPDMTIAENMFIGREIKKHGFADKKKMNQLAAEYMKVLDLTFSPTTKLRDLSVSEMQMIEIAKVVSYGPKIIIMDEPTSSITKRETDKLFGIIRKLREMKISIVYISHKLEELFELTDQITIMRDGHVTCRDATANLTKDMLIRQMVGREIVDVFPPKNESFGEVLLEAKQISRHKEFQNISFQVRQGEVLGFYGLVGAGRTETMMALFGDRKLDSGSVLVRGKAVQIRSPRAAVAQKIALIPEDRKRHGLNLVGSVEENIGTVVEQRDSIGGFFVNRHLRQKNSQKMIQSLAIRCNGRKQAAISLSGGNQQKIVLAKWLLSDSDIYILDEPTRGIDIGAKIEIYKIIQDLAKQGKAVILISSEMNEILGLCNRVMVMYEGKLTGELAGSDIQQEKIMSLTHAYKKEGVSS